MLQLVLGTGVIVGFIGTVVFAILSCTVELEKVEKMVKIMYVFYIWSVLVAVVSIVLCGLKII